MTPEHRTTILNDLRTATEAFSNLFSPGIVESEKFEGKRGEDKFFRRLSKARFDLLDIVSGLEKELSSVKDSE